METNEQPPRAECDGAIGVSQNADDTLSITVTHNGAEQVIVASKFNAFRVLAALALVLGVKLPRAPVIKMT